MAKRTFSPSEPPTWHLAVAGAQPGCCALPTWPDCLFLATFGPVHLSSVASLLSGPVHLSRKASLFTCIAAQSTCLSTICPFILIPLSAPGAPLSAPWMGQ